MSPEEKLKRLGLTLAPVTPPIANYVNAVRTGNLLFLAGKGSLVRDFKPSIVALPEGMPHGSRALKLVPNTRQLDYESLILVVEPRSLSLIGLVWQDAQGGVSSFAFTNLQENLGPADKQFVFAIPRGVDVVEGSSPR